MKHLALALLGWYLLLPPWVGPYKVNENAPYSQWKSGASCNPFPSFEACANYKASTMNALKTGQVKFTPIGGVSAAELLNWNYRVYWNSRCIQR